MKTKIKQTVGNLFKIERYYFYYATKVCKEGQTLSWTSGTLVTDSLFRPNPNDIYKSVCDIVKNNKRAGSIVLIKSINRLK